MEKTLTELMDEILAQINEQFEEAVDKLTKGLADLSTNIDKKTGTPKPSMDLPDGVGR